MNYAKGHLFARSRVYLASEHSSTGRFANRIAKSGDLQGSALPRSVPSEKLVYLGWAKLSYRSTATSVHQGTILTGNTPEFLNNSGAQDPAALRRRSSARISCAGNDHRPTKFEAQTLAATVNDQGRLAQW